VTFREETEPEGAVIQKPLCQLRLFSSGWLRVTSSGSCNGKSRAGTLLVLDSIVA
jgi:hypothetical protein